MVKISKIYQTLIEKDNYLLMGHIDPDGDCIGSLVAMKYFLDKYHKKSLILLDSSPEEEFACLDISKNDYSLFENFSYEKLNWPEINVIALDSGDVERLGPGRKLAEKNFLINIDHHVDNPEYGDINYVNHNKAAVGEILFDLLSLDEDEINLEISRALAVAIIADTGALRYQNTTPRLYRITADFMEKGVDISRIIKDIFGSFSYKSIKLRGLVLSTLEISGDGKIAWLLVRDSFFKKIGLKEKNTSGLVNYARDIKGVEVGIAFSEIDERKVKVAFRSNHDCPVNEIASFFGGGGHNRAAGCLLEEDLNQAVEMVIDKVKEYV